MRLEPATRRTYSILFGLLPALVLAASAAPRLVAAQTAAPNTLVALGPLNRNSTVELVSVTLDANLAESGGHVLASGNTSFKLHNTDPAKPVTVTVGFPSWAGGNLGFDPDRFGKFQVFSDGKPVKWTRTSAPLKIGTETRTVDWFTWTISLDNDEKQFVSVDFSQDLGVTKFPRFTYGMLTAQGWKGSVGSARISLRMPAPTTPEQFLSFDPFTPDFDGQTLTWRAGGFEPSSNESVLFVRTSDWNALANLREAAARNDNDPAAHYALAQAYQELAAVPTSRKESFSSLALAELEIAARLKHPSALTQLAQMYESRAGPPTGPRDVNYVALAMQEWQGLVGTGGEAEARRRLAEDSFYLAQDARAHGDFERALRYLDDAQKYSPTGAGPLYTPEKLASERKSATLAFARALADQGDLTRALAQAVGANGGVYSLAPAPTLPIFVLSRAHVTTNSVERVIELRVIALPEGAPGADEALQAAIGNLQRTNAATLTLSTASTEHIIVLRLAYENVAELQAKLRRLADALGNDEMWAATRAILNPKRLEVSSRQDQWTNVVQYREQIDLAPASQARQARLDAIGKAVADLDKVKPDDDAALLRRALLKQVYSWLQNAYAGGAARYEFIAPDGTHQEWVLNFNDSRELALDHSSLKPDALVWGAAAGGLLLVAILIMAWWISSRRRGEEEIVNRQGVVQRR